MQNEFINSLSRRALLGLGAGAAGGVLLGGCSNEGRGVQPDGGAGARGLEMPTSVDPPKVDGMVLSKVEGVAPAYTNLPLPGFESVQQKPGSGGAISTFTLTYGPPAKMKGNQWRDAINSALGVTLTGSAVPAQSFGDKLVTTIASGEIPDITTNEPSYRGRSARKYLPQGVFHDLREFLGGDKVKAYPNLAMVPAYAWKNSRINGALYGVPCYRNQTIGGTIGYRQDWAEKGGMGDKPTNVDELFTWLKAIKKGGGKDTWPLATIDQAFNFCGGQVHGVPSSWRLAKDGSLTKDLETDEFEAGLAFAAKLWKAGLVHPNVLTLTPNSAEFQDYFLSGRVGILNGSIDGFFGRLGFFTRLAERNPDAKADVLVPPGANGGRGVITPDLGFYCMLSIPASVKDEKRVDEILRVIDYLAAPKGSTENFLVQYGVKGHNYKVEDDVPIVVDEKADESFLSILKSFSSGFYFPGAPAEDALTCQKYAEDMTKCFVPDPTAGLDSETSYSKGDALSSITSDYVNAIVTGRKPVSDLAELRKRWKTNGGDQMRGEYEKAIAEAK